MQSSVHVLPEKFVSKVETFVPKEKVSDVLAAFAAKRPVTFRVNTLKTTKEKLLKQLYQQGFPTQAVAWYPDAYILEHASKQNLLDTKQYKEGLFYIQNLSSMLPALILDPKPSDLVLDMAASPGSKTTQLAAHMHNEGLLIANDKSPKRIFKLLENLKLQGVKNAKTSTIPGEFLWRKYPEYFDRVLIDAPCSMEGRIYIDDPKSYKDWSPRKIKELSNLQKWLLRSAVSTTRVGGAIVYSTCALSPEENEEVVQWILEKSKGSVALEEINLPGIIFDHGLASWKHKTFSPELSKTVRIYPTNLMEGFFIAKFKKLSPTI